jgi:hypothetical protein
MKNVAMFLLSMAALAAVLRAAPGRLAADVIPCITYKVYSNFVLVNEGITFWTQRERRQVSNFPKLHYQNGVAKHSADRTKGWYKPTVRLFKNARSYLIDRSRLSADVGPSYFLESILYNVPDAYFSSNLENFGSRDLELDVVCVCASGSALPKRSDTVVRRKPRAMVPS